MEERLTKRRDRDLGRGEFADAINGHRLAGEHAGPDIPGQVSDALCLFSP